MEIKTIDEALASFSVSFWLKNALTTALERDAVDAARDAGLLSRLLNDRCDNLFMKETSIGNAPVTRFQGLWLKTDALESLVSRSFRLGKGIATPVKGSNRLE